MSVKGSPELLEIVSDNLRKIRYKLALTMLDVSIDTDIHVDPYESKRCLPSVTTLLRLCEYYNCTPNDILLKKEQK